MRITDWLDKEEIAKTYPIFKGYPVEMKQRRETTEQHYVVPWEMPQDEWKKKVH